jgi:phage tail-like protein
MRKDPLLAFRFRVEIEGLDVAGFSEVTGLESEIEVHEYREGGLNDYIHKFPGAVRYPTNLVLKRGMVDSQALWEWCERSLDGIEGTVDRKTVDVVLLDSAGEEKRRWTFQGAYPVKWTGPELRATSADVALESLEVAHRGLDRSG